MPIAIAGLRPERYVPEPNSFWDHGLMKEFCPQAEAHVLKDSDDALMLELRDEDTAQDQLCFGRLEPAEVARNMIVFLTTYQKDFARFPLTLHSTDTPPNIDSVRDKLRAYIGEVFQHLPATLPSHSDHPQWNYHRFGFLESRFKHLSSQLGMTTAQNPPPASLSEVDRAWWKFDGCKKLHAHRRDALIDCMNRVRDLVRQRVHSEFRTCQGDIDQKLHEELMQAQAKLGSDAPSLYPQSNLPAQPDGNHASTPTESASHEDPLLPALSRYAALQLDHNENERVFQHLKLIESWYEDRLAQLDLEFEATSRPLRADYESL